MRFGLIDHVETRQGATLETVFAEHLGLARAADEAGLWGYHTTEHHLSSLDATPSPGLFLAALAPITEQIRLCSLVHIITGYHPVRLAQEVIMLDHLSGGRFELGIGKGVSPPEHRLLDMETAEIQTVFDDHLDRMIDVLEGKPVDGAPIPFSSLQKPYPPLWYAGNAIRAGELNLNAIVGGPPSAVAAQIADHRTAATERGSAVRYNPTVVETTVGATRHVFIDADDKRARRRADEAWDTYTRHINHHFWRTGESTPRDPSFGGDPGRAVAAGALVVGSPAQVAESYVEMAEVGGAEYLLGAFFWGDLAAAEAMRSFEHFVTDVIPAVESAVAVRPHAGGA